MAVWLTGYTQWDPKACCQDPEVLPQSSHSKCSVEGVSGLGKVTVTRGDTVDLTEELWLLHTDWVRSQ